MRCFSAATWNGDGFPRSPAPPLERYSSRTHTNLILFVLTAFVWGGVPHELSEGAAIHLQSHPDQPQELRETCKKLRATSWGSSHAVLPRRRSFLPSRFSRLSRANSARCMTCRYSRSPFPALRAGSKRSGMRTPGRSSDLLAVRTPGRVPDGGAGRDREERKTVPPHHSDLPAAVSPQSLAFPSLRPSSPAPFSWQRSRAQASSLPRRLLPGLWSALRLKSSSLPLFL